MTIARHIIDAAVADYVAGMSMREAGAGRCSKRTLHDHLIASGIQRRPQGGANHKGNPERRKAIAAEYERCGNYAEVGRTFGISKTGVLLAVRRAREDSANAQQ